MGTHIPSLLQPSVHLFSTAQEAAGLGVKAGVLGPPDLQPKAGATGPPTHTQPEGQRRELEGEGQR